LCKVASYNPTLHDQGRPFIMRVTKGLGRPLYLYALGFCLFCHSPLVTASAMGLLGALESWRFIFFLSTTKSPGTKKAPVAVVS